MCTMFVENFSLKVCMLLANMPKDNIVDSNVGAKTGTTLSRKDQEHRYCIRGFPSDIFNVKAINK